METTTQTANTLKDNKLKSDTLNIASLQENGILDLFKNYNSQGESLQVFGIRGSAPAQIKGEKQPTPKADTAIEWNVLKPKLFATSMEVSTTLLNNSSIDYRQMVKEELARRIVTGIQTQVTGNDDYNNPNKIKPLSFGGHGSQYVSANNAGGPLEIDLLEKALNRLIANGKNKANELYWIFPQFPKVSGASGINYITYENLPQGAVARVLGIPAFVAELPIIIDSVAKTQKSVGAVLFNPKAYSFTMSDIKFTEETDKYNKMTTIIAECWADGVKTDVNSVFGIEYKTLVV